MSDNFKGVLKQANNDVTGDAIRTGKGGNEKFAAGHEAIFGKPAPKQRYVGMNYKAECSPYLTMCPRCNNPHNACDQTIDFGNGWKKSPDVKLYGGCLGGGKSWQGSENLSTVFPKPLELDCIIVDEVTDLSDWTEADDIVYDEKACGCKFTCGATREEWDEDCFGWKECSHCDNGYFPCNQYCIVMD